MEYQDNEKQRLVEKSERHKVGLQNELNELSAKTDTLLTNALIIGGSLALTYFVVSQLTAGTKKRKKAKHAVADDAELVDEEPTLIAQMGSKFIDKASLFLLDIAKEKLSEYLQSKKREDS